MTRKTLSLLKFCFKMKPLKLLVPLSYLSRVPLSVELSSCLRLKLKKKGLTVSSREACSLNELFEEPFYEQMMI